METRLSFYSPWSNVLKKDILSAYKLIIGFFLNVIPSTARNGVVARNHTGQLMILGPINAWKILNWEKKQSDWLILVTGPPDKLSCVHDNNLLLNRARGSYAKYWSEIVAQNQSRAEGQYSLIRLEQARLVGMLLHGARKQNKKYSVSNASGIFPNGLYGTHPDQERPNHAYLGLRPSLHISISFVFSTHKWGGSFAIRQSHRSWEI